MIEVTGNLWTFPTDHKVITTNGTVKKNGEAVMGRGCAQEARLKWRTIAKALGDKIVANGNITQYIGMYPCSHEEDWMLYSFPVKHQWWDHADLALIEESAKQLLAMVDKDHANDLDGYKPTYVLPRPGCGNGRLKWEDVKPIIEPILDNRFHVITF